MSKSLAAAQAELERLIDAHSERPSAKARARMLRQVRVVNAEMDRSLAFRRACDALERELALFDGLGAPGTLSRRWSPAFLAHARRQAHARCVRLWKRASRLQRRPGHHGASFSHFSRCYLVFL
jgi:hypothetical protein